MKRWFLVVGMALLPTLAAAQLSPQMPPGNGLGNHGGVLSVLYGTTAGTAAQGNDARITGAVQANGGNASATTVTATGGTALRTLADRMAERINVKDFGAQGNTLAFLDGAMTAGSAVLNSNLASFTAADVGKSISVDGSGAGGAVQTGTIVAVSDSHDAVLSFTAATTVSGAQYHYGADDSAAFAAALNACQQSPSTHGTVYVPPGFYTLKSTPLPTLSAPCRVEGAGSYQSILYVDPSYAGADVFSWSEAWAGNTSNHQGQEERTGPGLVGLTIAGDLLAPNAVDAIDFYDRDDQALVSDVTVSNLNGQCLRTGMTKTMPQAYLRESQFYDLRCFSTGTGTAPAVEISSTTQSGSDATNELQFYGLDILGAKGVGLSIHTPTIYNATRLIYFFGGRVESSGADNVDIGNAADLGYVQNIGFYGFHNINPPSGYYAWKVADGSLGTGGAGIAPYNIFINSPEVGPGPGGGFDIEQGTVAIHTGGISVTGTGLTIGAAAGNVSLDADGNEAAITKTISGSYTGTFSTSPWLTSSAGNPTVLAVPGAMTAAGVSTTSGGVSGITLTNGGGTYTTTPTITIAAPPSGAQAQAVASSFGMSQFNIVSGGSGYAVGDVLTIQAPNCSTEPAVHVTSVSSGVITGLAGNNGGACSTLTAGTLATTGGTGSGATVSLTWYVSGATVTTAGSGYVSPPTVSFSPALGGIAAVASVNAAQQHTAAKGQMLLNSAGTTLGIAGPYGGPVIATGALIDGSGVRVSLGSTYTVPANTSLVRFTQSSTVSASTVTLPTALADGQPIQFVNYGGAVTALTFSPAVNGWTNGNTLAAYTGLRIRWDATAAAWYREE